MQENKLLLLTAFISGMSIMALEMSASRLLAPYFGSSLFVWTNIIGITMLALSIGYYYGGKIADKRPEPNLLYATVIITGIFTWSIPFIAPTIMKFSASAIQQGRAGLFYGSLIGTVLLFAPPISILGGVSPFTIRLTISKVGGSGYTAGRIFAVSTIGSIIGTFLPVLILIPFIGTKKTILIFGTILVLIGFIGLRKKRYFGLALIILLSSSLVGSAKSGDGLIYEKESVHNYIQVVEKNNIRYLKLNEGYAYHSIYNPESVRVGGVWDYFSLLPLFNPEAREVLIIGLAGGTIAREYRFFFPNILIDGIEIDEELITVGQRFFDMKGPNLRSYPMDGRAFLSITSEKYDIVIIDAYRQPYIPFHLTTSEFFREVKKSISEGGLVAINVASVDENSKILKALSNTIAEVYRKVYILNPPNTFNHIVIASDHELLLKEETSDPDLAVLLSQTNGRIIEYEFDDESIILTDDKAPVEMYTDMMIFDYILKSDSGEYVQLFE